MSHATALLDHQPFDVLVIGGGIVGAGVARDAALRGLRTCVIDQQDFSAGTSSRSSRLLHGGIRYLAQGRLGLVREASREKTILHRIAPHLSDPLAFLFPTRSKSEWSRWKLSLGVKIYDLLCGRQNLGKSRTLSVAETLQHLPGLNQHLLTGAVRYYDGLTNDARLTIDTLRSATLAGATAANYTRFVDGQRRGALWACQLEDAVASASERFEVSAKCVVNATGPWSHEIPNSKTSLRITKGVHLVIDRRRLPVPDAVVLTEGDRILFAIPWGERVILGTTDTDYAGPTERPQCNAEDRDYVLGIINSSFPTVQLSESDVVSTWAGLRPLVADPRGNPSDISRRHEVAMSHPGWWDVTGGKLTTYRLMAEETVNGIVGYLGAPASPCRTAKTPILDASEAAGVSGIVPPAVTKRAVEHYCQREWAVHLDDVMIRRTSWRHYHRDHVAIAEQAAAWMQEACNWPDQRRNDELRRYQALTEAHELPPPHFATCEAVSGERSIPS